MAELDKFERSRDQIMEMRRKLLSKLAEDAAIRTHVAKLDDSIKLIDQRIEELQEKKISEDNNKSR